MYSSLDEFTTELIHLSTTAVIIAILISFLVILIRILILWLIIKSAVYNGTKQALEESVAPRMLGLYDQIERNRNNQYRQQFQQGQNNTNNSMNNQQ